MNEKEQQAYNSLKAECGPDTEYFRFSRVACITVPHPWMITPKHVANAADNYGGLLTTQSLRGQRCGWRDCKLSMDEHESMINAVIVLKTTVKNLQDIPGLHQWLLSVKDKATALGITGFMFPTEAQEAKVQ